MRLRLHTGGDGTAAAHLAATPDKELQDKDTEKERQKQQAVEAARVGFISCNAQLTGVLSSRGSNIMGCAAAALCTFFVWDKADADSVTKVHRALTAVVQPDKNGCNEETSALNAMRDVLLSLLPAA